MEQEILSLSLLLSVRISLYQTCCCCCCSCVVVVVVGSIFVMLLSLRTEYGQVMGTVKGFEPEQERYPCDVQRLRVSNFGTIL
jgi:hypothetical protein